MDGLEGFMLFSTNFFIRADREKFPGTASTLPTLPDKGLVTGQSLLESVIS
jgi:hypothetical protein